MKKHNMDKCPMCKLYAAHLASVLINESPTIRKFVKKWRESQDKNVEVSRE